MNTKVYLGSDHAGFALKEKVKDILKQKDIVFEDLGCDNEERCDYPDFAHAVADALKEDEDALGILICGSGNGISIAANKHKHVRAALCWTEELGVLAKAHNNANVLSLPARFIDAKLTEAIVNAFLETSFEKGRHEQRVEKISRL